MRYYIDDNIAKETKAPQKFTLSNKPGFVEFDSSRKEYKPVDIKLTVKSTGYIWIDHMGDVNITAFTITTHENISYKFQGHKDMELVSKHDYMYYLGDISSQEWKPSVAAKNLRDKLLVNEYLNNNFDITCPLLINENGIPEAGNTIRIKSKGYGKNYAFTIEAANSVNPWLLNEYMDIEGDPQDTVKNDSLSGENDSAEILLDIYKDTGVFAGREDTQETGTYVVTLSKTYFGKPVWFDVNSMWRNGDIYSGAFLNDTGWTATGTVTDFRFTAKRNNGGGNEVFYHSDVLYAITGYGRSLEKNDMAGYVYDTAADNIIKPLTSQPVLTHIKGQKQYFNFILSDPGHGNRTGGKDKLGILYKLRSQSGGYIGTKEMHTLETDAAYIVNTICLDIDSLLEEYPRTGIVEVYLSRNGEVKSEPLVFHILPECLYKVNDFAFLNSLGGWNSFNFGGMAQTDFKSETTTIYRTQTPDFNISSRIESVFTRNITEQFTVQTSPVQAQVADWLKEMSASVAVYELSTKRYVIIDEFNIKHNTKDDLFTLQMKYHYSDM